MGIDNVAIKTFNSSGAQSVCRTNEADETKLIESQFLTKCTTEYINGSGMTHIQGNGLDLRSATVQTQTFNLPSDCDAISDVIYTGTAADNINKIEVKVGNLVVQTIKQHDIKIRNFTELGDSHVESDSSASKTFSIPIIGRAKNVRNSFLQAGAITNAMSLKFTYNHSQAAVSAADTSVCVLTHQITKTEKDFLAKNIINRVVNVSQNVAYIVPGASGSTTSVTIDLSTVHINVSHILFFTGLGGHTITHAELILGNDRTGNIPIGCLNIRRNAELFSLAGVDDSTPVSIIKTADSAFSTAGIPFSRLNNKKIILTGTFNAGADGSVTVCGTQIQTTVGGSISFSS
tara:strand:+ start:2965 stop:4005 length:1041 start_codon:yes stop_codon:yes gene_type:complete